MTEHGLNADQIDTSQPHPARMYDYYLGGRDNYEVDRIAADRIISIVPEILDGSRQNRAFMRRAVRTVVAQHGIRQIIDIGTGIPTSPNTHEVAQAVAPETRVVYLDNDPIVAVHANARLTGVGHTAFLLGDVREPVALMTRLRDEELIDFDRPVALVLVAVMHFVQDSEQPYEIVAELRELLPPGSFMALSHAASFPVPAETVPRLAELLDIYKTASSPLTMRSPEAIEKFFDGFEVIDPGVTSVPMWRPDPADGEPKRTGIYGGVGYKP